MSRPSAESQGSNENAIDLIAVLDMLWRSRGLVLKTAASIFLLGAAYAFLATPVYRSDLLVQIENNSDNAGTQLLGSLSDFLGVKSTDDAEMQILRSRRVVGAAVSRTRYDIHAAPKRFPLIGGLLAGNAPSRPGLFGLGGYAWGNEWIEVDRFDTSPELYGERFTITGMVDGRYRLSSSHLDKPAVGVLGQPLHVATDGGVATLVVKAIHAAPSTQFQLRRYSRQQTIANLQDQLGIVDKAKDAGVITVSLESTCPRRSAHFLNALGEAYVRLNSEQKAEQAQKSLEFLEQQLPSLKQELQTSEDALLAYRNKHKAIDLSESAKLQLGQVVALQTRVSLLEQDRRAKLQELTPKHPEMVIIDNQIGGLQRELRDIDADLKRLPATEQALVRLTRDVRVNTELYVAMLNSMQQLRLLRAGKVGNVHVVDQADVQELPVKPRRPLVILGALLFGLLAGVCAALLRALWKGSVTDPRELERLLDVPVAATVPLSKHQAGTRRDHLRRLRGEVDQPSPLAITHPHEPVVESLRGLAISLQLGLHGARNKVVVMTSPTPRIGKSFVSANLAVLLARAGQRVLLIDGDMRKGVLHKIFRVSGTPGLAQILRGELAPALAIQPSGIEGLDVICNGPPAADSAELLQGRHIVVALEAATAAYDVVLVDTAPLLPIADTVLLARHAGLVYAVARYGITTESELVELRARLDRAGVGLDGVVLNGVEASLQGAAYATYGYGYTGVASEYQSGKEQRT